MKDAYREFHMKTLGLFIPDLYQYIPKERTATYSFIRDAGLLMFHEEMLEQGKEFNYTPMTEIQKTKEVRVDIATLRERD